MRRAIGFLAAVILFTASSRPASADILVQNTSGSAGIATAYFGESFTTPTGGPFTNIAFNFYSDIPATAPVAGGTAFLLSQEYLGSPSALGVGTSGFLAASTSIVNNQYVFGASLVLQGGTKYYLYENAIITTSGGAGIAGGNTYFATTATSNFAALRVPGSTALQASNFLLSGNAVPEPSSLALCGVAGVVGLVVGRARRRPLA